MLEVRFTVAEGEFLAVIGLSGSGKSTLLRCINRLIEPTSGQVIWNGIDITAASPRELRRIFLDLVHRYATRVIGLKDGMLVFEGHPKELTRERFKEVYGEEAEMVTVGGSFESGRG